MNNTQKELLATSILMDLQKYGRERFIEDTIVAYKKEYPRELKEHLKYVKRLQGSQKNKFASTEDQEWRAGVSLPRAIFDILNKFLVEPRFLEEIKEYKWFLANYPEFVIPEKI